MAIDYGPRRAIGCGTEPRISHTNFLNSLYMERGAFRGTELSLTRHRAGLAALAEAVQRGATPSRGISASVSCHFMAFRSLPKQCSTPLIEVKDRAAAQILEFQSTCVLAAGWVAGGVRARIMLKHENILETDTTDA